MNALLIYKSEVSGELKTESIKIHEEYDVERIIKELVENTSGHMHLVFLIDSQIIRIPVFKCVKDGKRYSVYKLVGAEIE